MEIMLRIVVFQVGTGYFGIDIRKIERIVSAAYQPEAVEDNPSNHRGLLNIRENIVPILNLHEQFQAKPLPAAHMYYIIVNLENKLLALPSEGIGQYYDVSTQHLYPLPVLIRTESTQYIQHIVHIDDMLIPVLDLEWLYHNFAKQERMF